MSTENLAQLIFSNVILVDALAHQAAQLDDHRVIVRLAQVNWLSFKCAAPLIWRTVQWTSRFRVEVILTMLTAQLGDMGTRKQRRRARRKGMQFWRPLLPYQTYIKHVKLLIATDRPFDRIGSPQVQEILRVCPNLKSFAIYGIELYRKDLALLYRLHPNLTGLHLIDVSVKTRLFSLARFRHLEEFTCYDDMLWDEILEQILLRNRETLKRLSVRSEFVQDECYVYIKWTVGKILEHLDITPGYHHHSPGLEMIAESCWNLQTFFLRNEGEIVHPWFFQQDFEKLLENKKKLRICEFHNFNMDPEAIQRIAAELPNMQLLVLTTLPDQQPHYYGRIHGRWTKLDMLKEQPDPVFNDAYREYQKINGERARLPAPL
ncbi:hypothetical protein BZG36_04574 [Bifiguratus adelaidae]|uniref:F-box domain-containing protein n=1 Tax=Bifiguratus adelaidae TaxID=1938954 RepID=A0A261XV31_9FUNG|nr:hypothetical protein BZG36_04574 [Bifiguratus adelaidae]